MFCDSEPANVWVFNRTSACIHDRTTTYLEQDPKTGATLGFADLAITQVTQLDPQSAAWTETVYLTMTAAGGQVSELNASLAGSCTPSCAASGGDAFGGDDILTDGATLIGTVNLSDNPAPGAEDLDEGQFVLDITQPGTIPTNPEVPFGDQVQIRCDDALSSDAVLDVSNTTTQPLADPDPPDQPAGCVYPGAMPTFVVSLTTDGAAAAAIFWAQTGGYPDSWGLNPSGTPLTRMAGRDRQIANRDVICPKGKLSPISTGDSCDEYPFAATNQSGSKLTPPLTFTDCAELIPVENSDGSWTILEVKPVKLAARCFRSHVPDTQNSAVGRRLGTFAITQRLLDKDPYWVGVQSAAI